MSTRQEETKMARETMVEHPISRRAVLQGGSLVGLSAFLAACGGGGATTAPGTGAATTPGATGGEATPEGSAAPPEVTGPLNFANWDAYIDLTEVGDGEYDLPSPTLDEFAQTYNVEVNYANAVIEDNESFMATIQPQLQAGLPTGWDLVVLTDWMAAKVIDAGWAEAIDPAHVPTAMANIRDELKGLVWDPDMKYHFPWQSGATGVGYNAKSTGRDLTSIGDLFDPAFKGKVTLLTELRDTYPLIFLYLQSQGKAPAKPASEMNADDAKLVNEFLQPYVDNGHIKAFTGNEYLQDFGSGDVWAAIVWSGDLASSGGPDDVFVYPDEGSMAWNDNMVIPKAAENKYTAELMMDFVYDVDRAARLANFIWYISPVKGVVEAIKELDAELAENPLLFPPPEVVAKQVPAPTWDEETEKAINELYAELSGV
jgi:spermidine/putrescine transport system substrate-binding protein